MSGSESKIDAGAKIHALSHAALVTALREENRALWNRWRCTVISKCVIILALLTAFAVLSTWPTVDVAGAIAAVVALIGLTFIDLASHLSDDPVSGVPVGWLLTSRYGIDHVDRPDDLVPVSGALEVHRTRPGRRDTWTIVRDGDLICVYDTDGNALEPAAGDAGDGEDGAHA